MRHSKAPAGPPWAGAGRGPREHFGERSGYVSVACLKPKPHPLVLAEPGPALASLLSIGMGEGSASPSSALAQAQLLLPFVAQVRWRLASCIS